MTEVMDDPVVKALKAAGLYDAVAATVKTATVGDVHVAGDLNADGTPKKKPLDAAATEENDEQDAGGTGAPDDDVGKSDVSLGAIFVSKLDPEKKQVFGWASVTKIDGKLVIDKQGDIIPTAEIEKAAYDFVLYSREQGDMHTTRGVGKLIESMVFDADKAACGIVAKNEKGEPMEGWWVGFQIDSPAVWEAHKRGERPEFSIGGRAKSEAA